MSEALLEMMAPIIEPIIKQREEKARQANIQKLVCILRDLGHQDAEIRTAIMQEYNLSAEEADEYLKIPNNDSSK